MADEKKIIVDDDWKAQAQREKEQLSKQASAAAGEAIPFGGFTEIVNLIAMQALAALGALAGPGGERMPVQLDAAKHFIDMLQVLEDKTRNNLTPEEKRMLDQVTYEVRMRYVQMASAGAARRTL